MTKIPPKEIDDIPIVKNKVLRIFLIILGSISWFLGLLGIFLPLLPTTPFILLAATCYGRASKTFYSLLLQNQLVGPYIYQWRKYKSIPPHAKWTAITLIIITISLSIYYLTVLVMKIILFIIGITVIGFIMTIKTNSIKNFQQK